MKLLFLVIGVLFFSGCINKNDSANVIPRAKMVKVLWDMMQVDEFANAYIVKDSSKNIKLERMKLYEHVFKLNNISRGVFNSSFKYYAASPDILKIMYDSLGSMADNQRKNVYMHKDSSKLK